MRTEGLREGPGEVGVEPTEKANEPILKPINIVSYRQSGRLTVHRTCGTLFATPVPPRGAVVAFSITLRTHVVRSSAEMHTVTQ